MGSSAAGGAQADVLPASDEPRPTLTLAGARDRWIIDYARAVLVLGGVYQVARWVSAAAVGFGPLDVGLSALYAGVVVLVLARAKPRVLAMYVVSALGMSAVLSVVQTGFLGGSSLFIVTIPVLGLVFFDPRLAYVLMSACLVTFALIGAARVHGGLLPPPSDRLVDPRLLVNWVRMAIALVAIGGPAAWLVGRVSARLALSLEELARARELHEGQKALRMAAEESLDKAVQRRQQSSQLEASGVVISGVAHDLRNALGVLLLWSDSLRSDRAVDAEVRDAAERIAISCRDATRVTAELMGVVHTSSRPPVACAVREQIDAAVSALQRALPEDIAVDASHEIDADLVVGFDAAALLSSLFALAANTPFDPARGLRIHVAVRYPDEGDRALLANCGAVVELHLDPPSALPDDFALYDEVLEAGGRLLLPSAADAVAARLLLPTTVPSFGSR